VYGCVFSLDLATDIMGNRQQYSIAVITSVSSVHVIHVILVIILAVNKHNESCIEFQTVPGLR
jgi:hypothetical protein